MSRLKSLWARVIAMLEAAGAWAALLPLRLLMAYEYGRAGFVKLGVDNPPPGWFAKSIDGYPFPFNVVPAELSWFLATWTEILGGIGLFFGLFTRFWAASLVIMTLVIIFGVHWPDEWSSLAELWKGYAVTDKGFGNFRIPLLFLVMLLPLVFFGGGKLSADYVLSRFLK